jgi:hypothetical protein
VSGFGGSGGRYTAPEGSTFGGNFIFFFSHNGLDNFAYGMCGTCGTYCIFNGVTIFALSFALTGIGIHDLNILFKKKDKEKHIICCNKLE